MALGYKEMIPRDGVSGSFSQGKKNRALRMVAGRPIS